MQKAMIMSRLDRLGLRFGRVLRVLVSRDPRSLTIQVKPDELDGGWVARCPDLPGAYSQGDTEREAVENLLDAIGGVLVARMHDKVDADFDESTGHVVRHLGGGRQLRRPTTGEHVHKIPVGA